MPSRTRSATAAPKCHVLNFTHDDKSGCTLTVLNNAVRFHIMVEEARLKCESIRDSYLALLDAVRSKDEEESDPDNFQGAEDVQAAQQDRQTGPRKVTDGSLDSAVGSSPLRADEVDEEDSADDEDDSDSAVDVGEAEENNNALRSKEQACARAIQHQDKEQDPHTALQNWIPSHFGGQFEALASPSTTPKRRTLHEWYHAKTHFFTLETREGELELVELEESPEYHEQVKSLIPRMKLPKYLSEAKIPWFSAKDILVLSESDELAALHPARIQVGKAVHFLKLVDSDQHAAIKRELKILLQAERLGLAAKVSIPKLEGLVAYEDSKTDILGFLMTDISDPTPLTLLLDEEVDEAKRMAWAAEVERVVGVLHDHGIVWGDAKADNFLVDRHDRLWIIDFGGSYTDGWVDAELNETQEGDEMGVQKIVAALQDPESQTFEPGDEAVVGRVASQGRKRNRDADGYDDDEQELRKKRKS